MEGVPLVALPAIASACTERFLLCQMQLVCTRWRAFLRVVLRARWRSMVAALMDGVPHRALAPVRGWPVAALVPAIHQSPSHALLVALDGDAYAPPPPPHPWNRRERDTLVPQRPFRVMALATNEEDENDDAMRGGAEYEGFRAPRLHPVRRGGVADVGVAGGFATVVGADGAAMYLRTHSTPDRPIEQWRVITTVDGQPLAQARFEIGWRVSQPLGRLVQSPDGGRAPLPLQ